MTLAEQPKSDWLKISQFVLSLLAFCFTILAAAGFFAGGILFNDLPDFSSQETTLFSAFGSFFLFQSIIHLLAMIHAIKKTTPPQQKTTKSFLHASLFLLFWAIILVLQYFQIGNQFLAPILPFLTPLAVWIPIWWFVEFGKRKITPLSSRKRFGALSTGSSYTMILIMCVEIILIAIIGAIALLYFSSQPQFQQWMQGFSLPQALTQIDTPILERYLRVLLQEPLLITGIFLLIGLVIPFIEESLKPLALWLLRKRSLSVSEGFLLGLYFGAAFALIESGGMVIQLGLDGWVENILLRSSTALIHITCSGLVGYGYARAMQPNSNKAFMKPLFISIILHGIWNSLAVLTGIATISAELDISFTIPMMLDHVFTGAMVVEWIAIFILLNKMNKKFSQGSLPLYQNEKGERGF